MNRLRVRFAIAAIAGSAVLLGGCTTRLSVEPIKSGVTPVGAPFPLYFDQFRITIDYQLAGCDDEIVIKTSVEVDERIRSADPLHSYVIDPNSLAAFNKTAEATIKYFPTGMPSSINAKADDRTVEIAGALIKSAVGIAKLAAGGAGTTATVKCNAKARAALDNVSELTKSVKSRTEDIARAQDIFDKRKAQVEAAGAAVPKELRRQFSQDFIALQGAQQGLADAKKRLEAAKKALSVSVKRKWPSDGTKMTEEIVPDPSVIFPLLDKWVEGGAASVALSPTDRNQLAIKLEIEAEQPDSPYVAKGGSQQVSQVDREKGIPYRNPQWGTLRISSRNGAGWEVSDEKRYEFLQLGRIFVLPCVSKPLTSISCNLAFNENGRISEAGTSSSKAPGEAAAGLLGTAVSEAAALKTALDGRALKAKQDELAMLEIDGKIATARKAQQVAPPTQKQQWEDEIAMLDAERRLIEARLGLEEAKAKVDP